MDARGFVVTGFACPNGARAAGRRALPLEISFPEVFVIGDVRAGSTERVAAAVGEGAAVVAQIHTALALSLSGPDQLRGSAASSILATLCVPSALRKAP